MKFKNKDIKVGDILVFIDSVNVKGEFNYKNGVVRGFSADDKLAFVKAPYSKQMKIIKTEDIVNVTGKERE